MKKLPFLLFLLLILPTCLPAQTEKRYVVNAGGGTIEKGNINLTYFIGDHLELGNNTLVTETGDLSIYPNPVRTNLFIESNIRDLKKFQIYNVKGLLLSEKLLLTREIDFSAYPAGIYLLKFQNDKDVEVGMMKVIKY